MQKVTHFAEESYKAKHKHPIVHYLERVLTFILAEDNVRIERSVVKLFLQEQRYWRDTAEWKATQALNQGDVGYSAA